MQSNLPRPPYDQELNKTLTGLKFPATITPNLIPAIRARPSPSYNEIISNQPISHLERLIPGPDGNTIIISVFRSTTTKSQTKICPGIIWYHGGGFFSGSRFGGVPNLLPIIQDLDAVVIAIEYRLAPEHPNPAPVEDCYAVLLWVSENLAELGINPRKLVVAGSSAGGGLTAGVALLARNRHGPRICAQLLQCPMIDDRLESVLSRQYVNEGTFSRGSAETGWDALLGERRGGEDVSIYAAPSRASNLSGLPEAFIEVGSAEVFRDENMAFAERIWEVGGQAELHVWPGAYHRFEAFAPAAELSVIADKTREAWVKRVLSA
jgi:acetyl esterase/lipase